MFFHPYLGKIPILTNIFQMGWFNHQLDTCGVHVSESPISLLAAGPKTSADASGCGRAKARLRKDSEISFKE